MFSDNDAAFIVNQVAPVVGTLSRRYGVLFVFNEDMRVGLGGTSRFDSTRLDHKSYLSGANNKFGRSSTLWAGECSPDYVVSIGVRELYSRLGQVVMSRDVTLAALLTSVFHEMRHVQQYNVGRGYEQRPDDMSPEVMWSLVASCDNSEMYHKNYRVMPHEIDAECIGRISAYDFMVDTIGLQSAQRAMSAFSLYSIVFSLGFVRDLDFSSFDKHGFADKAKVLIRNASESVRNVRCLFDRRSPDFASNYFSLNGRDCATFKSLKRGSEQDVYLAKINVKYNEKERDFFNRPSLSFPMGASEPCGGVVNRGAVAQDCRLSRDVNMIDANLDASYMYSNDEEMNL